MLSTIWIGWKRKLMRLSAAKHSSWHSIDQLNIHIIKATDFVTEVNVTVGKCCKHETKKMSSLEMVIIGTHNLLESHANVLSFHQFFLPIPSWFPLKSRCTALCVRTHELRILMNSNHRFRTFSHRSQAAHTWEYRDWHENWFKFICTENLLVCSLPNGVRRWINHSRYSLS